MDAGEATTDTVMFLKQQELLKSSQVLFDQGKQHLFSKDYKEALKAFTNALKLNPGFKEAKYFRAITYLDAENNKKCIGDLNELLSADPAYNKTVYVVLSIAHRRENDLNKALHAVSFFFLNV